MKILVTGGSGFIGTNFISKALNKGYVIYNVDNLSLFKKDFNKKCKNYIFSKMDVNDKDNLSNILKKFKPNKIVHFAAESHVDNSIKNPLSFMTTNVLGTYNVLQASLEFYNSKNAEKNFCFHHISTDEVYGSLNKEDKSFTEKSKYKPNSPYAASKASSDHLVRAWQKTYNLPCVVTSCTNNFGPYQHPEKFIPVIILNGIMKKKIPIYGQGFNFRDWIYVEDHVDALLKLIEKNVINKRYLIGANNEKQNFEIADIICGVLDKVWDKSFSHTKLKIPVKDRPGHDFRYSINSQLIQDETNWKPKFDFLKAVENTVFWYLNNKNWWKEILNIK